MSDNYFTLFNMPLSNDVDLAMLKSQYYALQKQYHPDKADGCPQISSEINEGYQTLKNPLKRAAYLLRIFGQTESKTVPEDFLMEQFALREQLESLGKGQVLAFRKDIQQKMNDIQQKFTTSLDNADFDRAKEALVIMRYYDKLLTELSNQYGLINDRIN